MRPVTLAALLATGCSSPPEPKPDGSCGIRGTCLLPAEPADNDGKVPERQPWAGVVVTALRVNSPDADYKTQIRATADAAGEFRLALNPGEYSVGVHDPTLLKNKMLSPMLLKVEAGRFTEVVVDYDKLNVRDLPGR